MNTDYDNKFREISGLTWLPYVGADYPDLPRKKRLLILGESNYHLGTAESIAHTNTEDFTRWVIEEMAIPEQYYSTKFHPNLYRVLFGTTDFNKQAFWDRVAFHNLVQTPMSTVKGRPTHIQFFKGWDTLLEVLRILKPQTCLCIGTLSSYYFEEACEKNGITGASLTKVEKIGRTYPRLANLSFDDSNIRLVFIQHTSSYFSWQKWHAFLKDQSGIPLNEISAAIDG